MLEIKGLRAGYGQSTVLEGVDLVVPAGKVTALMGRNGMGKTTLLRALMGLLPPRAGTVRFGGRDMTGMAPHLIARAGIGYVPQGREVFEDLTVAENLRLGRLGRGLVPVLPAALFTWFPILAERADQKAGTFSGGQQQMLAMARALAGEPTLLLLDEPTEGIQPSIVHEIALTLRRIVRETGLTILVVEQNVDLVLTLADQVAFMDNGRIVETCGIDALSADERILARHLSL
jgi:urea ABC transporter ATP-binding protein UrtE